MGWQAADEAVERAEKALDEAWHPRWARLDERPIVWGVHGALTLMVPLCLGCTCGYCALQRRQKTTAIEAGEPEASPAAAEPALA